MLLKGYTQHASKFGKLSSGHRTGKGQFSFQSQRRTVPMNVQSTNNGIHFICYVQKVILKILQARLQHYIFISVTQSCPTLCHPMDCSTPDFPVHHQFQEPTQTHVNPVGDAIKPSQPLSSPHPPPSIFSSTRVFSNESVLQIRWTKNWSFSFSITSSNQYSELISFRIDRLNLLEVQGTLKSLLQHHSSKASILWCYAFFIVQLSHPYMTTGKTISLD